MPAKGLETYTPEDIERVQALLKTPDGEKELEKWVKDWVNAHLYATDASQLIGPVGYNFIVAEVTTEQSTSSTTFTDLATVGPQITTISAGKWQFWWGFQARNTGAADTNAQAGLETSWSGLSDSNVASCRVNVGFTENAGFGRGYNNTDGPAPTTTPSTITMKYRAAGGSTLAFSKRWLVAVKVSEL